MSSVIEYLVSDDICTSESLPDTPGSFLVDVRGYADRGKYVNTYVVKFIYIRDITPETDTLAAHGRSG